ncbi:hypothetical protein [Acidovorax sp. SUPP3334]|uniref:hypothetical protein n=1 Tax=Acidovorax sp. SUPP3334 TaxID=2920881 RepID=UPI0023DE227F|nr:hypothetical protein [Acidovorax sp. SUPP3334]GKT21874.1 hypothetical protein AVHM3334_06365 [Acidovorax sp. SUPP3334]
MSISIAGHVLPQSSTLSESAQVALSLIDGGLQWLRWATTSPSAHYHFPDEAALVSDIQQGLHGSGLALLPGLGLTVSPAKLMTLELNDLRTLARVEAGDADPAVMVQGQRILREHRLLTATEFQKARAFLGSLGVAEAPVFQSIDFIDGVALCELPGFSVGGAVPSPALQAEAAAFAIRQAHTPREFVDYYRIYLHLANTLPGLLQATPAQRGTAAEVALQALLPALFGALESLSLMNAAVSSREVSLAISNWLAQGRRLGFSRLSEGIRCIVEGAHYRGETGAAAANLVEAALQQAMAVLGANRPGEGELGQDGVTLTLSAGAQNQQVGIRVSGSGFVSLSRIGRAATPAD